MRKPLALLLVLCLLASSSPLLAATSDKREAVLRINHKSQKYVLESFDSQGKRTDEPRDLKKGILISLRPGETIQVLVDDPNPFLFSYALSTGKETPTANGEVAQNFAEQLLSLVKTIDPTKKVALLDGNLAADLKGSPLLIASLDRADLAQDPSGVVKELLAQNNSGIVLDKAVGDLKAVSAPALAPDNPAQNIQTSQDYAQKKENIVTDATASVKANPVPVPSSDPGSDVIRDVLKQAGIKDAGSFLQDFKGRISKLYLWVSDTENLIPQIDDDKAALAYATVETWNLDQLAKDIDADYETLHRVKQQLGSLLNSEAAVRRSSEMAFFVLEGTNRKFEEEKDGAKAAPAKPPEAEKKDKGKDKDEDKEVSNEELYSAVCKLPVPAKPCQAKTTEQLVCRALKVNDKIIKRMQRSLDDGPRDIKVFEKLQNDLTAAYTAKATLCEHLSDLNKLGALRDNLAKDPFYLSLGFILPYEHDTRGALKEIQEFKRGVKKSAEPLEIGTVNYSALRHGDTFTVKLAPDPPNGLKSQRAVRDYSIEFQPYSGFDIEPAGSLVYSFVEKKSFTAVADGSKFKIQETKTDYNGVQLAAMMTISPRSWAVSDNHALFELGVKPSDHVGLYGGVGFKFSTYFSIGGGVAFEQVDKLKTGLAVGGQIDKVDDLKTEKRFTSGLYLHFTFSANLTGDKK